MPPTCGYSLLMVETGEWGCFLLRRVNQMGVVSVTVASDRPKSRRTTKSRAKSSHPRPESDVKKAIKQLSPTVEALPEDTKALAAPLVLDCARLAVTMDRCWSLIENDGPVTSYDNGSGQTGTHENPAFGAYVKASRNLSANIGKLIQMVGPGTCAADNLSTFLDDKRVRS